MVLPKIIPLFVVVVFCSTFAQERTHTIRGTVKDAQSGEVLIGATIRVHELTTAGAVTNEYGFYSLTLPAGTYALEARLIGHTPAFDTIALNSDCTVNFELHEEPVHVGEVVVSGERTSHNVTSTDISINKIETRELRSIPVLLGEKDVLKTIQLLPGIKSAGEGSTGFSARGGGTDQNLILLDEAPVYNPSHLLGFLSTFNSDAIKDVKVITGGIPAEYGGRLSSVVDIRTNDGNMKKFTGTGGIGLLASRLTLEGPILKDTASFLISGRRTYADLFLKLSGDSALEKTILYFYDLNAKVNYAPGDNDRIFLSAYLGSDNMGYPDIAVFRWSNATATLRWNHVFGSRLFSNTSFIVSNYDYSNNAQGSGSSAFVITSGIRDLHLKTDFQYFISPRNSLSVGANVIEHTFNPGTVTSGTPSIGSSTSVELKHALEDAVYASQEVELSTRLKVNYGARLSSFSQIGPGTAFSYSADGQVTGSIRYGSNKFMKTYLSLEPRVALNYLLDETTSLKASYDRTAQYLHLLSNSALANPRDLWVPSTKNIPPQYADQYSLGYFRNFNNNEYEGSLEVYYKSMANLIDYKNGANLQLNPTIESQLLFGKGWSYGLEFLLRKQFGKFTGWLGYTLSKTDQQFAGVNEGKAYPSSQDRTHDVSVVVMYDYSERWNFSATWVYYTGNAVTFPGGLYSVDGRPVVPYYTDRNSERMPAYHRLDLSVTYNFSESSNLNLSLYNAYDRMNPYLMFFQRTNGSPPSTEAVQLTIFPLIPSLTYNFKF